jgi:uncharacterized membrane protein
MMIALRLIHVLAGVFWAGAVFFVVSFLLPSMRDAGPGAQAVSRQLIVIRKYPLKVLAIAIVTVLSGIGLYMKDASMSNGAFARSHAGMTYGIGAAAALATLVVGFTVLTPAANRLGALGAVIQAGGAPPTAEQQAEMARLQARMTMGSRLAASFLLVTVITMAVARYV